MYETVSQSQPPVGYIVEELTKEETRKLKTITTGYGKLRRFSREVGLHENTLRSVILKGTGRPDTIKMIRERLTA